MANRNFRSSENRDFGRRPNEQYRRGGSSGSYTGGQGQYRNEDDNWWGRRSSFEGGPGSDDEFEGLSEENRQGQHFQHSRDDSDLDQRQFGGYGNGPQSSRPYGGQYERGDSNFNQYHQGGTAGYGYGGQNRQDRSRGYSTAGQYGAGQGGYRGYGGDEYRRGASDHSRRGPKNYQRSDERLKEDICDRLLHDVDVDASDVTVEVKAGKVTLEGTVPARYMKHTIEDIADDCYGVKEVDNKVRVSNGSSDSQSSTSTTEAAAGRVK